MEQQEGFLNRAFKKVKSEVTGTVDDFKLKKSIKEEFEKNSTKMTLITNLVSGFNYNKQILAKLDIDNKKITLFGNIKIENNDILNDKNGSKYVVKAIVHKDDYIVTAFDKQHKTEVTEVQYQLV